LYRVKRQTEGCLINIFVVLKQPAVFTLISKTTKRVSWTRKFHFAVSPWRSRVYDFATNQKTRQQTREESVFGSE